ncbi:MAG: hypothetical protein AB4911_08705 [Oscillochloridaceae bacterium umkhey_bin13]
MQQAESTSATGQPTGVGGWLSSLVGRILISVFVPLVTFIVLWQGFLFLRDTRIPLWITAIIAVIWGVGGVWMLFAISNYLVEQLPHCWRRRLTPYVFVGPALAILTWYLVLPTIRSFIASFYDARGQNFVGLANYIFAFALGQDCSLSGHACGYDRVDHSHGWLARQFVSAR